MDNTTLLLILMVFLIVLTGLYLISRDYIKTAKEIEGSVLGAQDERKSEIVSIDNFAFNPPTIETNPGTTVIWINNDESTHNVRSAVISSPDLSTGDSYSFKFQSPGIYEYHCGIHPEMRGKIVVSGGNEMHPGGE